MIQSKYNFIPKEVILTLPENGKALYHIENSYPINYQKEILGKLKKEVALTIHSDEEQPYIRFLTVYSRNLRFESSTVSNATKDILSKIDSIYDKLNLRISYLGKIMSIDNITEIQENWNQVKTYITGKYRGEQVKRLINKTDETLSSGKLIRDNLLSYQNLGGLLRPLFKQYTSNQQENIQQYVDTKYGKILATEYISLESDMFSEDIVLRSKGNYPKDKNYVTINGSYAFVEAVGHWLNEADITVEEKYGRQVYRSSTRITKRS